MKELSILNALTERLRTIKKVDGFYTDLGRNVYQGRIYYDDPDERPFVTLALADDGTSVSSSDSRGQQLLQTVICIKLPRS